jgi:hypothetical protein
MIALLDSSIRAIESAASYPVRCPSSTKVCGNVVLRRQCFPVTDATTTKPIHLLDRISDFQAYIAPMAIFMAFTLIGGYWPSSYPWTYLLKTVVVPSAMWFLWPRYTPIRWDYWWLGIIVGVIGIFQWVGMQLYLQQFPFFAPSPDAFDPIAHFQNRDGMRWAFIGVRTAGAVLVVPLMEELFWRDFSGDRLFQKISKRSVLAPGHGRRFLASPSRSAWFTETGG